jgi:hypothetical protein
VVFAWQKHQPHETTAIINEQEEEPVPAWRHGGDGTVEIPVDEVEDAACTSPRLLGEGSAPVLACQAGVTELFNLLQRWQSVHHVVVGEAAQ